MNAFESAEGTTPATDAVTNTGISRVVPWLLSGNSTRAIQAQAARLRSHLEARPDLDVADVGYSLARSRAALEHRAVVLGSDHAGLLHGLEALSAGDAAALGVVRGRATASDGPVLVFPGHGSQWQGMGRELLAESEVFAACLAQCDAALSSFLDWSVLDMIRGTGNASLLDRVDIAQPALWAVMVSLAEVWRSVGVRPAAVVGHSIGEIAAACVSGALSLDEGARVVALRSRALASLSGGGMTAVAAPVEWVEERLGNGVEIAAVNGPASTVIAGEAAAVRETVTEFESVGVRTRKVNIGYAAHTTHVARVREQIMEGLSGLSAAEPRIPFWSTVTGEPLGGALDAEYWYRNERHRVRFAAAVRGLIDAGHSVFLEVGPHPLMIEGISGVLEETGASGRALGTLRRDDGGWARFVRSMAEAFVSGVDVDWDRVFAESRARPVDLPVDLSELRHHGSGVSPRPDSAGTGSDLSDPVASLADMPGPRQRRALGELVRGHAAAVLGHASPDTVPVAEAFRELGFDSVMAVELRTRLAEDTGLRLPTTVLFDHPTPAELVDHLQARLLGRETHAVEETVPTAGTDDPVAVVAMGCRFPGGVSSPEGL
ncbi:acyltransferase domain-containing protein, partial [Halostreptopolyspora alba]